MLAQPEIQVRNAEVDWHDESRGAPALKLSALNLRLRNSVWEHSAGLSARLPPELGTSLEIRADLSGHSFADRGAWRGTVYVESGYTELAAWRPWVDYPFELKQGHGAVRLWAGIERGRLASLTADLQLLDLLPGMAPTAFRIGWKPSPRNPEGAFSAKDVDLTTLAALAGVLPVPEGARKRIAELAPRGRLQDLKVEWKGPPEAPVQYSARARFTGASMNAAGRFPGFSGLSGALEASEKGGSLKLDSKQAGLFLPELFPEPRLALDALSGQLSWTLQGEHGWTVRIASLSLANADLEGHASGWYATPGFGRGAIDLTAEIRRADGARIARYLPHGHLMGPRTHDYLASSIKAGRGRDAKLRLRGELADFPFRDPARGEFQVTASVDEGVFEPGEGWPRIEAVDAQLLFERDRMEITGRSGVVHGARLSGVRVEIPELSVPRPHLVASGQADGSIAEYAQFMRSSPVRGITGGLADDLSGTGRGHLELKLDLPLEDRGNAKVAGEFSFSAATLAVHADLPPIERASGRFAFTESSFVVRQGRGRLFGGPLAVSGGSRAGGGLDVTARGDASMQALAPLLPPALARHLAGAAPYSATLSLRDGRGRVTVESSLRGMAITLPPPLAKGASDALPLRLDLARAEGGRDRVSIQLGSVARGEILRQREAEGVAMSVQRAAIWLSPQAGEAVRVPERPGVLVYGTLPALDADRWLAVLDAGAPIGSAGSSAPVPDLPVALDVRIGALDVYGKRIHDLALAGKLEAGGWSAKVGAQELAGELSYRSADGGALVARLSHLTLSPGAAASPSAAGAQPARRDLPAVDLVVDRLTLKTHELGRVEVVAARADANWRIDRLSVANEDGTLTGKGTWRIGAAPLTSLTLDLDAPHPGRLLRRLGYGDVLRGGHVRMQASLTWAGDVTTIDYPSLSGEIQMQAEDGRFVQLDPGVGKLLSVMSLQALPRRLTLDFRDVFSSGFQFERVRSAAHIDKGIMVLKDFQMSGSSAQVEMSGRVDLVHETQALSVRVVPQIGDTASTALLFVNPFLFFPAAIAQRILKDPLGHIFAFNYSVAGSWDDPKIERTAVNARPVAPESSNPVSQ